METTIMPNTKKQRHYHWGTGRKKTFESWEQDKKLSWVANLIPKPNRGLLALGNGK